MYHFDAASQYRKSLEELEGHKRYGTELARLSQAHEDATRGYAASRRSGVAPMVIQDVKNLVDTLQKNLARAERDNDLIYHQDVPARAALPPIQGAVVVKADVPSGLSDPKKVIGDGKSGAGESMLFGELLGWGAREAINIYVHNRQVLIQEQITEPAQTLDNEAINALHVLNLPASLEALERPAGLPPSLLQKAEEVRLEDGPARIEASIESVHGLAQHVNAILDEAMDVLDDEAAEDEHAREDARVANARPPSHDANVDLIAREKRYRDILAEAQRSDAHVRQKWDEWEHDISILLLDERELEESIPSSTVRSSSSSYSGQTRIHARALRIRLESLDDLKRERLQLVERAQRLEDADDIMPRIIAAAAGIERWAEMRPEMFADASDNEMAKYDKFVSGIEEGRRKQQELLGEVKAHNEAFLQSRKDDPSIKEREHALQSLDIAYHKYREITRNLDEGLKFYNDLAEILSQFKETCKAWSYERREEIRELSQAIHSMSLQETAPPAQSLPSPEPDSLPHAPASQQPASAQKQKSKKPPLTFPSINSTEWETLELPPGPPQTKPQKSAKRSAQRI